MSVILMRTRFAVKRGHGLVAMILSASAATSPRRARLAARDGECGVAHCRRSASRSSGIRAGTCLSRFRLRTSLVRQRVAMIETRLGPAALLAAALGARSPFGAGAACRTPPGPLTSTCSITMAADPRPSASICRIAPARAPFRPRPLAEIAPNAPPASRDDRERAAPSLPPDQPIRALAIASRAAGDCGCVGTR